MSDRMVWFIMVYPGFAFALGYWLGYSVRRVSYPAALPSSRETTDGK